jgi:hypothetical protein
MVCKRVVCECPVISYDVILGIDWLTRHSAIINCTRSHLVWESLA